MKLELKEFEANLALAKDLTGEVRQKYLTTLRSAEVYQKDDKGVEMPVDVKIEETAQAASEKKSITLAAPAEGESIEARIKLAIDKALDPHKGGKPFDAIESKDTMPAEVAEYSEHNLKSFKGKDAAKNAWHAGQFLLATSNHPGAAKARLWCENHGMHLKVAQENVNSNMGIFVPPEFNWTLIRLVEKYGVFRQYANVLPMSRDTLTIPRRTGGYTAYPVTEGAAVTESDLSGDSVTLSAKMWGVITRQSRQLLEDSVISFADLVAMEMALAFAQKEDNCGFNGDGGGATYSGIEGVIHALQARQGATVASIAGLTLTTGTGYATSYASITLADFLKCMGKLPLYAQADPSQVAWYCHQNFWASVMCRVITGVGGVRGYEIVDGIPVKMFMGYPVIISQVMPSGPAVSQVPCLFGNLGLAAKFGDRRQVSMEMSTQANVGGQSTFERYQMAVMGTERFDIVVHDVGNYNATVTSQVPGPILGLITATS